MTVEMEFSNPTQELHVIWNTKKFIVLDTLMEPDYPLAKDVITQYNTRKPTTAIIDRLADGIIHIHLSLKIYKSHCETNTTQMTFHLSESLLQSGVQRHCADHRQWHQCL
jgi:hypothetical protein